MVESSATMWLMAPEALCAAEKSAADVPTDAALPIAA